MGRKQLIDGSHLAPIPLQKQQVQQVVAENCQQQVVLQKVAQIMIPTLVAHLMQKWCHLQN